MILALIACGVDDSAAPICPPEGTPGTAVGEVATDVTAVDCAGGATALRDLCGQPALIVSWYGWCPTCGDNAALARELAEAHADLGVVQVLEEDPLGEPVDADLCAAFTEAYPSPAQVWLDTPRRMEVYGTTDLVVVLDRDGLLSFVDQTSAEDTIVAAVDRVLAR